MSSQTSPIVCLLSLAFGLNSASFQLLKFAHLNHWETIYHIDLFFGVLPNIEILKIRAEFGALIKMKAILDDIY